MLSRHGEARLKEWISLLTEQGWSKEDKCYLVDYWLEHHDENGVIKRGDAAQPRTEGK